MYALLNRAERQKSKKNAYNPAGWKNVRTTNDVIGKNVTWNKVIERKKCVQRCGLIRMYALLSLIKRKENLRSAYNQAGQRIVRTVHDVVSETKKKLINTKEETNQQ